jgi:hypothetical protein
MMVQTEKVVSKMFVPKECICAINDMGGYDRPSGAWVDSDSMQRRAMKISRKIAFGKQAAGQAPGPSTTHRESQKLTWYTSVKGAGGKQTTCFLQCHVTLPFSPPPLLGIPCMLGSVQASRPVAAPVPHNTGQQIKGNQLLVCTTSTPVRVLE